MMDKPSWMPFPWIEISIQDQKLRLHLEGGSQEYSVSTASAGIGEQSGSGKTPRGWHLIRAKIGADQPENSVFVARRPTGEIYTPQLAAECPDRDWILTRILWLSGCEVGRNRLADVDSMRRFIYIHGTPDSEPMGVAKSHGCIRMRNKDVIELFDQVQPGTQVWIQESTFARIACRSV